MTVTTVFADAGDGNVRARSTVFATVRAAASANEITGGATGYASCGLEVSTYNFYCPFFMFDTSAIPATDTISSAVYSHALAGDSAGTAANQWTVCQGQQTTWNSLVIGDYDQRRNSIDGGAEGATRQNRAVSTETGYVDFTLNATGIGWIARSGETKPATASATGKTQLVVAYAKDLDNSAPTTNDFNQVYFAEEAGTTNDPKLVVTHVVGEFTKLEPQYLLANTLFAAGTALQTFLTKWDSTEWDDGAGTTTFYFQAETANGSTSDVTLDQADGGGVVTNSTLTNIDNAQISIAMTMPASENLDTKATTNAGDVAAARILVAYVFAAAPPDPVVDPWNGNSFYQLLGVGV